MSHIDSTTRDRIRELNDAFRKGERPDLGRVVITPGVRGLVAAWPLGELGVYEAVQRFDDFGAFEHVGNRYFWKLDYYDRALESGSEDPSDPSLTTRVLTIMLAEEY